MHSDRIVIGDQPVAGGRGEQIRAAPIPHLGLHRAERAPIAALLVSPGYWLLLLPLLAVIAGPALLIASRANSPILFLRLCVLYFLYGLARAIDLLGLVPSKKTWKAR